MSEKINEKSSEEKTIELGKWLIENEVKFTLDTRFYGEEVVKVIKIKCNDIETEEDTQRDFHIIIKDGGGLPEFFVGKWED